MAFDLNALKDAVAQHGRVARVVIAAVAGSAPREVGASMLVWDGGQSGTIGGGALEYEAAARAFERSGATRHALGPALGQCCGGAVTLWTEVFDVSDLGELADQAVILRGQGDMPLSLHRLLDRARARGQMIEPQIIDGWMVEPMAHKTTPLWIWGAGHVGRALVDVLSPLPDLAITWVDTGPDRFPETVPSGVDIVPAARPEQLVPHAPKDAQHLILTYSHELDFQLCHSLLSHSFGFAGLIGSDTKWTRFRKRLKNLGHGDAQIECICCPIGQKSLGKHPHSIAIGVAAQLMNEKIKRDGARWETSFSASTA